LDSCPQLEKELIEGEITMNASEKRARLGEIDTLLLEQVNTIPPEKEMPLLYEAMGLCEDLGLDRAWRRFKAFQERLNQDGIDRARQA
jgi:hypothetical protein